MELYVFRHGIAEDHGPDGSDASRRLTREGVEKTTEVVRGLAKLIDKPDVILTSPKVRAKHTAEIVGKAVDMKPETFEVLAHGPAAAVVSALAKRKEDSVIIVGHEPTLSEAIESLLFGEARGVIELKKAGCAALTVDPDARTGRLIWLATPKILRAAGCGA